MNRGGTIRPQRVENTANDKGADGGSDGMSSVSECVKGGEALKTEIAAYHIRRDVGFAAGAEADQRGCNHAHCQRIGNGKENDSNGRGQQHGLINTGPESSDQEAFR